MQVNKLHIQPHTVAGPKSQKQALAGSSDSGSGAGSTRKRELTFEVDAVRPYADQLQSIPEVRTELVEAARTRVANGEYKKPQAAAETAAAILRRS